MSISTMAKMLDYYTVTAERETGFWIGIPVASSRQVSRDTWLQLMEEDPEHFQLVTLTSEDLSMTRDGADGSVERAVFVAWSDEQSH